MAKPVFINPMFSIASGISSNTDMPIMTPAEKPRDKPITRDFSFMTKIASAPNVVDSPAKVARNIPESI